MRTHFQASLLLVMACLAIGGAVTGCGGSGPLDPLDLSRADVQADRKAVSVTGKPDLDAFWPNEDGRRWEYWYQASACEAPPVALHATPEAVPPAPAPEQVLPLLGARKQGPFPLEGGSGHDGSCLSLSGPYVMQFDGAIVTGAGVTAQHLRESLRIQAPAGPRLSGNAWSGRFLSSLADARPELRGRIMALEVGPSASSILHLPWFLHGGAWEKTREHIGTYGDLEQRLAWVFLEADVSPGSRFEYQLVPSLADDVYLHAWVVPQNLQWKLKDFAKDIQVVYVLDYGIGQVTDESGNVLGYTRHVAYGTVVYAPGIGPVLCAERFVATAEDPARAAAANLITLVSVTPGAIATAGGPPVP